MVDEKHESSRIFTIEMRSRTILVKMSFMKCSSSDFQEGMAENPPFPLENLFEPTVILIET